MSLLPSPSLQSSPPSTLPFRMPPVDLETLFCGGCESKIACESNIFFSSGDQMIEDPDLPPESIQVPIRDDLRWSKLNKVFDREQSTIGNANPKSSRISSKPKSNLQRLKAGGSIKPPNGPILGLANSTFHGNGSRPLPTLRIFPLNFSVERKPAVPDPGSPKVSCFGSVLSEREKKLSGDEAAVVKGPGCWPNLAVILRLAGVYPAVSGELEEGVSRSMNFSGDEERRAAESTVPELQGMKKFASVRRSCSWVDGVDGINDGHVVSLEPLDRECALRRC